LYERLETLSLSTLARGPLRWGTYFDKVGQIGLRPALVGKRWLAAFIVTCKLGLVVGWASSNYECIVLFPTFVR